MHHYPGVQALANAISTLIHGLGSDTEEGLWGAFEDFCIRFRLVVAQMMAALRKENIDSTKLITLKDLWKGAKFLNDDSANKPINEKIISGMRTSTYHKINTQYPDSELSKSENMPPFCVVKNGKGAKVDGFIHAEQSYFVEHYRHSLHDKKALLITKREIAESVKLGLKSMSKAGTVIATAFISNRPMATPKEELKMQENQIDQVDQEDIKHDVAVIHRGNLMDHFGAAIGAILYYSRMSIYIVCLLIPLVDFIAVQYATIDELQQLPRIGERNAGYIISQRKDNIFSSVQKLVNFITKDLSFRELLLKMWEGRVYCSSAIHNKRKK
jgi:hypothetical protein